MVLCAFFTALTVVCAQIAVPLPFTPVPLSLATLGVLAAGGLLGAKYGMISQVVYVLLGAVGVPVFANFTGGLGKLAGPTGGYLIGYILTAGIAGALCKIIFGKFTENSKSMTFALLLGAFSLSVLGYYLPGTLWFAFSTGTTFWAALVSCVFPFLPGDALKIAAASLLMQRLYPRLHNYRA